MVNIVYFADSIIIVDDMSLDPVQPIVQNDDEDVIFVSEVRQRQRTIATIDLCNIPDSSVTCEKERNSEWSSGKVNLSPKKSVGMTKCPICLDVFEMNEILSTMCGHLFCEPCIRNVIKTRKKCPMCNKGLKSNQIHRIFIDQNL